MEVLCDGDKVSITVNGHKTLEGTSAIPHAGLIIERRGWPDTKDFYDRLPARAEKLVRQNVWNLGHDSAGMCVRFVTDATTISARWTLRRESLAMPHMPATGVSGLDLYVRGQGHWHWVGNGRPAKTVEEKLFYVSAPSLLGNDGEATVEGTHPTDLGFVRMADAIEPVMFWCEAALRAREVGTPLRTCRH
jgi:hypothetical protein